jgi:hypothetical protein
MTAVVLPPATDAPTPQTDSTWANGQDDDPRLVDLGLQLLAADTMAIRAHSALAAGDAPEALRILDEHINGRLTDELVEADLGVLYIDGVPVYACCREDVGAPHGDGDGCPVKAGDEADDELVPAVAS